MSVQNAHTSIYCLSVVYTGEVRGSTRRYVAQSHPENPQLVHWCSLVQIWCKCTLRET